MKVERTMRKSDLLNSISKKTGIQRSTCEMILDALVYDITESLTRGEKVTIKGFMNFDLGERAERKARNPSTGEIQLFPAVKTVKCKMCKEIRDAINKMEKYDNG